MLIKLGYNETKWKDGIKDVFFWNTAKVPHILISGITGGGKTVLSQMLVNPLLASRVDIAICDYKAGGDWNGIIPNYAEFTKCEEVLNEFYNSFIESVESKVYKEKYLVFDEFSSYALSKDTKEFKELMSKISHIAFMGRSFGYHLIFISQQFNAKVLDTAIREQFGIKIYMGSTISTESATMLFPNCEINKSLHLPSCCGYISTPEKNIDIIRIPYIKEPDKLKKLLVQKGQAYFA
ncbi:FtsK/SpoIIIE domain-containing protein [Niameybacter massiliensis]|uniref:ATP-binding protein n=1 Tax=Niameybacter massiliensis TaxID=1658108 RepID=UPI0006B45E55|nr:ATP-binding protein [Niameybacter massiliensis]